jgi:UDP-2-acetamido-2,6-beta-L-arabino-hexul-4-ose reductase
VAGSLMKVLVTGATGFIGRNLVERLKSSECPEVSEVLEFALDTGEHLLGQYCAECDFVMHLAGVNRPEAFIEGNVDLTVRLLGLLKAQHNTAPVLISSSTQAATDNPYGRSKRAAEEAVREYASLTGAPVFIYRLPGVFGKWCRPNYNSVVATFCHNVARGLPVVVNDRSTQLPLVYVDDVVREFVRALEGEPRAGDGGFCEVPSLHEPMLGEIVDLLEDFRDSRRSLSIPDMEDAFTNRLYSTYLSYLPSNEFSYPLVMKRDERGSFTEIIRTPDRGQFSVNVIKPGVTKGDHWHDTKNEKFVVVSGEGVIRFRNVGESAVIEYAVSGEEIQVVDIPPGYTHSVENTGDDDMVVFMWSNECFDPQNPDTHPLVV